MSISDINRKNGKMPAWSRIFLAVAGLLLVAALFLPAWKMELSAPQYPEGLTLYMYPDKLAGDVHSINDLNHYIGMKTLHTDCETSAGSTSCSSTECYLDLLQVLRRRGIRLSSTHRSEPHSTLPVPSTSNRSMAF